MIQKEIIPAFSEKIVQLPTREKGIRYIESQEIQSGLFVARCYTECVDNKVTCLLVNATHVDQVIEGFPCLSKPPRLERVTQENKKRNALLNENLRLSNIMTSFQLSLNHFFLQPTQEVMQLVQY